MAVAIAGHPESGPGQINVMVDDTDPYNPWSLPTGAVGETIAIPLDVEYHWPDVDKSVASAHKTVYAQKGIVVRVQVPACGQAHTYEIWAGESRPIYATLNGKYNDGAAKCGDVPWTYDIVWQFAEPVWEEEGSGEDVTYTPRPPDESQGEEIIPSTILTGGHRLKHDTSPLYVGDMTSTAGGLAYARAIIKNVNIDSGEVVQGTGTTTVNSAWVAVLCTEEVETVDDQGYVSENICIYSPEEIYKPPTSLDQDYLELLCVRFLGPLSDEEADVLLAVLYDQEYELQETSSSSKVFENDDASFVVTLNTTDFMNQGVVDSLNVTVYNDQYDIDNETVDLVEIGPDSDTFMKMTHTVYVVLTTPLSDTVVDEISVSIMSSHLPHSVEGVLRETGVNTNAFTDEDGLNTIDVTSFSGFTPTVIDTMDVLLDCYDVQAYNVECSLNESDVATLDFGSHIDAPLVLDGFLPFTQQSRFKVVARRWPGVIGDTHEAHLMSPVDLVSVPVIASVWNNLWVSDVSAAVPLKAPAGSTGNSEYDSFENRAIRIARWERKISDAESKNNWLLAITTSNDLIRRWKHSKKTQMTRSERVKEWERICAIAEARDDAALRFVHGYALVGTSLGGILGWGNHTKGVAKICKDDLKLSPNRLTLKYFDFIKYIKKEREDYATTGWYNTSIYYTLTHSYHRSYKFVGLKLAIQGTKKVPKFSSASFKSLKHRPLLVFFNGCITCQSDREYPGTETVALAREFNPRCYIGYRNLVHGSSGEIEVGNAAAAGTTFFKYCAMTDKDGNYYTVAKAMAATNGDHAPTADSNARLTMAEGHHDGDFSINFTSDRKKLIPAWAEPGPKP